MSVQVGFNVAPDFFSDTPADDATPDPACKLCRFYTMYSRTCALTRGKMEAFDSCSSYVWDDDKERYGKRARERTDG